MLAGIFKIEDSVRVAKLWGERKNRPQMNYDKLSRSIRQYYKKGIIKKTVNSKRLVYQFCPAYMLWNLSSLSQCWVFWNSNHHAPANSTVSWRNAFSHSTSVVLSRLLYILVVDMIQLTGKLLQTRGGEAERGDRVGWGDPVLCLVKWCLAKLQVIKFLGSEPVDRHPVLPAGGTVKDKMTFQRSRSQPLWVDVEATSNSEDKPRLTVIFILQVRTSVTLPAFTAANESKT